MGSTSTNRLRQMARRRPSVPDIPSVAVLKAQQASAQIVAEAAAILAEQTPDEEPPASP